MKVSLKVHKNYASSVSRALYKLGVEVFESMEWHGDVATIVFDTNQPAKISKPSLFTSKEIKKSINLNFDSLLKKEYIIEYKVM